MEFDTEDMEKWLELLIKWGIPEERAKKFLITNIFQLSEQGIQLLFPESQPSVQNP